MDGLQQYLTQNITDEPNEYGLHQSVVAIYEETENQSGDWDEPYCPHCGWSLDDYEIIIEGICGYCGCDYDE